MKITIFDKEISLRDRYCQFFSHTPSKIESPYINLYIRFKGCNASCSFCEYSNIAKRFNIDKYIEILTELKSKIDIRKIAYTGGEPTLNYDFFRDVVNTSYEISPFSSHSMNTNGLRIDKIIKDDDLISKMEFIHISRHHYDDKKNNEILKFKSASNDLIKELSNHINKPDSLFFSCNLIKGYIDNLDEIIKFIDSSRNLGIYRHGFVSLMQINDYCKNNFVNFNHFDLPPDKFYKTKKWTNENICECYNYVYVPNNFDGGNLSKLYFKNTYGKSEIGNNLLFDGQNLYYGFDNTLII